ncbi:hypothetical protein OE88DRAFT_413663 [Heliocybe sulcata]|uniref:F-box domain-containing protein n=1 Tax=Heliocybe sulcata TaxID=5364 RepID=A0A5C3MVJ4_9AGAM|nr:hypothetical protein OE88DRAFT_413663 [Heliocybe sulcata]
MAHCRETIVKYTLPAELWIMVFRHAVTDPVYCHLVMDHSVFIPAQFPWLDIPTIIRELAFRRVLVSVSKLFRMLALPFLYEHVIITSPDQGVDLREKLRVGGYGRCVRSALIAPTKPYPAADPLENAMEWIKPQIALSILGECPNIRTVIRPSWFALSRTPAGNIARLDWKYFCKDNAPLLYLVAANVPDIRYLSVTFVRYCGRSLFPPTRKLTLPLVTTLRLPYFDGHVDAHFGD